MNARIESKQRLRRTYGRIGLICLLLIIPVKAIRFADVGAMRTMLVGIAPSLLGPAGLLFIILSGSGKLTRLTLFKAAICVAVVALGLEFAQLLPRPGILAKVHYTFDRLDIIASTVSICMGYLVALFMIRKKVV